MSAAETNITIEQGATYQLALSFNGARNLDGSLGPPIDISTWVFTGQIRANFAAPVDTQDFTFTLGPPVTYNNADVYNQTVVSLTATQTAAIPVNPINNSSILDTEYSYDIFANTGGSSVIKVIFGNANVIPRVTQ